MLSKGIVMVADRFHLGNSGRANSVVHLAHLADSGKLDNLPCPKCGLESVSVWFTQPTEDEFRTWFVCENCDFKTRAQNSERPHYFQRDRIDKKLEIYDKGTVNERMFPPPSDNEK
jgi:hypothetical protein